MMAMIFRAFTLAVALVSVYWDRPLLPLASAQGVLPASVTGVC